MLALTLLMCPPISLRKRKLSWKLQILKARKYLMSSLILNLILQNCQLRQEKSQAYAAKQGEINKFVVKKNMLKHLMNQTNTLKRKQKKKRLTSLAKINTTQLLMRAWMRREERSFGDSKRKKSTGRNSQKPFQASMSPHSRSKIQMGKLLRFPDTDGTKMGWLTFAITALTDIWTRAAIMLPWSMTVQS